MIQIMGNDIIVTPKEEKTVTITIRVDKKIQEQIDELAKQSNRSRNELINLALYYALQNVKFVEDANSLDEQ